MPSPSPRPVEEAEVPEPVESEGPKGRGAATAKGKARTGGVTSTRKVRGRTVYLPDDLFERILVQAHRRDKTISEYVTMILDRQVPDYRRVGSDPAEGADA